MHFAVEGRYRLLDWLAWTELEIDNIRAVLRRCIDHQDSRSGIDLAACLIWYWITRATTEGVRWLDELLCGEGKPAAHAWVYFARGFLAVLQNDPAAARPALELGVTAAMAAGQRDALSQSLAMSSIAANMAGDRASSGRLLDEAGAVADGLDDLGTTLLLCQAQALNGIHDGDIGAVKAAASQGARLSREAGDLYSLEMMLLNQGFAALISGDFHQAWQRLTEGLQIARQLDDRVAQCHLIGGLGWCAARSREPRLAAQLFGAMENLRVEAGASINVGMAPALAQATTSVTEALGPSRFAADFKAGQQLSRDAAARLALREAAPPAAAASAQPGAGVLRQRETDVAQLVAEGLSNKEIGGRLFISERTVESHVRNIMNKLGFNSRAQIAAWMATPDR
jgi:DNA-binding CsgD family transcriptional regulator